MRSFLVVIACCLVPQVALAGGEAGVVDRDLQVRVTIEALCTPEVLEALGPILVMERSISNKKLSKVGFLKWKRERTERWQEARQRLDPIYERGGIKVADLIDQTARQYDKDTPALEAIRKRVAEGMTKKCPKAMAAAKLEEFEPDDVARVVVYGYREN